MILDQFRQFQTAIIDRLFAPAILKKDTLLYWRANILISILLAGSLFGIFALASAISVVIKERIWILAIFDGLGFLICVGLLVIPGLSYQFRAATALALCFLVGLGVIFTVGPFSGGPVYLFTFAVLAGVLLGTKAAVSGVILNGLTISIVCWLIYTGHMGHTFPFFNSVQAAIAACVNFLVLNVVATVSVSVLVKGLVTSHQQEMALAKSLAEEVEERRQAEEAVRESEQKYRLMADNVNDMIWILDLKRMRITYCSPSVIRIRGYTSEEVTNQSLEEMLTPGTYQRAVEVLAEEMAGDAERDPNRSVTVEVEQNCKDGTTIWTELVASFIRDNKQRPIQVLGVARDITERKEAQKALREKEEKLIRSKKMESLALMAGGIAHDLNNILSGITSYPDLLLMDLPTDSPIRKPMEVIRESGQRAAAVVADLLTVARGIATSKEVLNLNAVVEEYVDSAQQRQLKTMNPDITFKTALDPDLLNARCAESNIKKCLMNLVINASEAIENSGTISISTKNRYLDRPLKGYVDVHTGEYVVLTVEDDGIGISSEHLERIFEPFYTKKMMGRSGTGLGLAVVWNAVQDHDGYINVTSNEAGTKFELYFPATGENGVLKPYHVPITDYFGNGEKILVVDDEGSQRLIACDLLNRLGYIADAVASGEAAVAYLKENAADLVLLDMIMPHGINGRETYEKIIRIHPAQKTIICSGYAETEEVKAAQKLGAGKFIKKPYAIDTLAIAVWEELQA